MISCFSFHRRLRPKDGPLTSTYLANAYSEPEQCYNILNVKKSLYIAYMTKAKTESHSSRTDTHGPKKTYQVRFKKSL